MCDIHTVRAYDSIGKLSVFGSKVKKGETIYEHTHTQTHKDIHDKSVVCT